MAAIEKLSRKRSAVKGKLTSFKSYLDINKTCRQLSDIQLEELDLRLSKIVASLDEFDDFQGQIEELVDDSEAEEQFKHRSDFEAEYYSVIAEARVLANKHRLSLKDDESEVGSSASNHDINLADPSFNIPSTIDILVGAHIFWQVLGTNKIELGKKKPTLFETKFGWLVTGDIQLNKHNKKNEPHNAICMFTQDTQSDTNITRFWELDSVPLKHKMTSDEQACEELFAETTIRKSDGRFVVTIPLKESPDALGDSYYLAKKRFLSVERKLEREPRLKKLYVESMDEAIALGHMSESKQLNIHANTKSNFIPHLGVLKETSSTTKCRVVADSSAPTSSGKSFNDIQRVGPTVQDDLLSILIRFRQHKFVVSADIEKMYRQIEIVESQRPLQQILWRSDPSQPLKAYTLNTVTFGTASAPYLATKCLSHLGTLSPNTNVKRAICHDFYVDDLLTGEDSIPDTIELCKNITSALESAKFNLRKWHSNNREILQAVSSDQDVSQSINLSSNELSKTLGINWNCSDDTLCFQINIAQQQRVTKRRVLDMTHLTYEEMSTLLIQIEAILNSRPLTPLSNDPSDLYPLTPSHFLIGRSLTCVPHPQINNARVTSLQRFQRIELLKQHFWNRFSNEYILWLQNRTKWRASKGTLEEGTMVIVKDQTIPPLMWLLGRVVRVFPGNDGIVRVADIKTRKGIIRRAFNNICPLPIKSVED
ncbi:hypothetical protein O0L34_g13561 [Tuta absoluta]|nr:hypothetical protein O0L34_g13561 [Tuta absoluta]